jgi:hypothetical protein
MRPGVNSRLTIRTLFTPLCTPVRRLGARVLEREGVLVDATERLVEVGHDLLRADDEDHLPGARA